MGFGAMAKMAAKAAAKQAKAVAKNAAKEVAADIKGAAKNAAKQQLNKAKAAAVGVATNQITRATGALNQAQARAAQRIGAAQIGTQAGLPVMAGPRGGNFRLNAKGQRLPVLPVRR